MKAKERHHLKQNEFAHTTARVATTLSDHRKTVALAVVAVVLVAVAAGVFWTWRQGKANEAGALLGEAMAIVESQIAPPSTLPGQKQSPGTYPTQQAKSEAALKAFDEVATTFPGTDAALAANYQAAAELLALGRASEAADRFKRVIDTGGTSIYRSMAQMGWAEALRTAGRYDDAIKAYSDLAGDRTSNLPTDGVLMQLADTYLEAGKAQDAKAAFKRVVDEFPESSYLAQARQQMAALN